MATKIHKEYILLQKLSAKKIEMKHNKKVEDGNTTKVSVFSQIQHPLCKNLAFKVN